MADAARAIAAGVPIDWHSVTGTSATQPQTELLRELRVVEDIADLHRTLSAGVSPEASVSWVPVEAATDIHDTPTWGSLRLLEHVGRGAFGDVYRAWDPRLAREVALKLLRRRESVYDALGSLVIEEGRLLARVRHPNVVAVYGADRIDGRVGLWMEFLDGRTLETVLREDGPLDAATVTRIGIDLCAALAAVHAAGTLHLDIKAQNVMQEASGRVVLMDFGAGREHLEVAAGELSGTPLYIAPDVLNGAAPTIGSDIYSVGVLLYHLLTAHYPVEGMTLEQIREAHKAPRRPLQQIRPDLPRQLCEVIETALAASPDRRFGSVTALMGALTAVAAPAQLPVVSQAAPPVRSGRAWVLPAFAAVVALLCVVPLRSSSVLRAPRKSALSDVTLKPRPFWMPQKVLFASVSRDGRTMVYSSSEDGNLYRADIAGRTTRQLTNDAVTQGRARQAAEFVSLAPDQESIAYTWQALDGTYELRTITMENAVGRPLLRDREISYIVPYGWTHDSTWILTIAYRADKQQLLLVSAVDARRVLLQEFDGAHWPRQVSLSPDDQFVLYDGPGGGASKTRDIFIVGTDGAEPRRLIAHPANDGNAVWAPDGRHVLFTSDRDGTMDLWRVEVAHGEVIRAPERIHRDIGKIAPLAMTTEPRFVYERSSGTAEVYQVDLIGTEAGQPSTLAANPFGENISSLWSPDGTRVAYASRRGLLPMTPHSTMLVVRDLRTGHQTEFDPPMNQFLIRAWSPDGSRVLIAGQGSDGIQGARSFDLVSGETALIARGGTFGRPDWLPDGRIVWIERSTKRIIARDPLTNDQAMLFDLRSAPGSVAADVYGRGFRLSPDGKALAVTSTVEENGATVNQLAVLRDGHMRVLAREPGGLRFQDWLPDGSALLFTRWRAEVNGPVSLWRVNVDSGVTAWLGLAAVGLRDVSVSRDGTHLTFTAGWPAAEHLALDLGRMNW